MLLWPVWPGTPWPAARRRVPSPLHHAAPHRRPESVGEGFVRDWNLHKCSAPARRTVRRTPGTVSVIGWRPAVGGCRSLSSDPPDGCSSDRPANRAGSRCPRCSRSRPARCSGWAPLGSDRWSSPAACTWTQRTAAAADPWTRSAGSRAASGRLAGRTSSGSGTIPFLRKRSVVARADAGRPGRAVWRMSSVERGSLLGFWLEVDEERWKREGRRLD